MTVTVDEMAELRELRLYRRRMDAMWEMVGDLSGSIEADMTLALEPGNLIELSCCSCVRVMGVLHACTSIMMTDSPVRRSEAVTLGGG